MSLLDEINAATDTPVQPTVSPSVHPASFADAAKALVSEDSPATAEVYRLARSAAKNLYENLHIMEQAVTETNKKFGVGMSIDSKTKKTTVVDLTNEQKEVLAAQLTEKFGKTARTFESQYTAIIEAADKLATQVDKSLTTTARDSVTAQQHADIREYLRSMPDDFKRMSALHEAVDAKDSEIIFAVLATTPFASGLNRKQAAEIREFAAQEFAGRTYAQHAAVRKIIAGLQLASGVVVDRYSKLMPVTHESAHDAAIKKLKE